MGVGERASEVRRAVVRELGVHLVSATVCPGAAHGA